MYRRGTLPCIPCAPPRKHRSHRATVRGPLESKVHLTYCAKILSHLLCAPSLQSDAILVPMRFITALLYDFKTCYNIYNMDKVVWKFVSIKKFWSILYAKQHGQTSIVVTKYVKENNQNFGSVHGFFFLSQHLHLLQYRSSFFLTRKSVVSCIGCVLYRAILDVLFNSINN